jgi:hypothetical protein
MTINEKKQLNRYIKGLVREAIGETIKGSDLGGVFSTDDPKAADAIKGDVDDYDWYYGESPKAKERREKLSDLINRRSRGEDAELELPNYPDSIVRDREAEKNILDTKKAESDSYDRPFGDLDDTENLWHSEPGYEDTENDEDEGNIAGLRELRQLAESYARESLREMDSMPPFWNDSYGPEMDDDENFEEDGQYNDEIEEPVVDDPKPGDEAELDADPDWEQERDWPRKGATAKDDPIEDEDDDEGLYELRQLAESYARESVSRLLAEKKGGWKKKSKKSSKKDKSKKKISSSEKTIMDRLNNDAVNAAHYYYKLYGVENGTEDEKAAASSLGYKKAKGKKLPGKNGNYRFSSKERNKLYTMMTTDNN